MKIVIVGGVAGGASCAARLRRQNEQAEIIMLERGPDVSFANCGLPYHISGVIKDRNDLTLVSDVDFKEMFNVDVRIRSEVIKVDPVTKKVTIKNYINNNEYEETYDKLVLSPGAYPIRPKLPGIQDSRVFTLRNLEDMDAIKKYIHTQSVKKAAVIGAGFIGLEMAENLNHIGIDVSVIEMAPQVLAPIDYEMASFVHQHLQSKGVKLILKDGIAGITPETEQLIVQLQSQRTITTDIVILAIGVIPEIHLAETAGLEIGPHKGIKVNQSQQTSDPDIYALGDATEIVDIVSGQEVLIPLANSANKQGRVVADHIMGIDRKYPGTTGAAILKIFDLTVASTGNNEKFLKKNNTPFEKVYLQPSSHAGYYPQAHPMIFKFLYNPKNGQILGAQIIGVEGVDKRIDVVSAMLYEKKTVYDLAQIELAYAPPFSSAKDPVNLAGMIAINQIEGKNPVVSIEEIPDLIKEGALILDARSQLEYDLGHIEGAKLLPLRAMRSKLETLNRDQKIIIYCNQGKTAYFTLRILQNNGFKNVFNLNGGYKLYHSVHAPQDSTEDFANETVSANDDVTPVNTNSNGNGNIITIDACGLQCPGPILKLSQEINAANVGDIIELQTTDHGFQMDIKVWCERTGNQLVGLTTEKGIITGRIQKGAAVKNEAVSQTVSHDKTIVVFSNDLDRALASFIIANGAAAMNRKTTMFFTFWGLNILRKSKSPKVKKSFIEKMFGRMMPKGTKQLKLSQMNMMGMGTKMMRRVMGSKNVDSLETLIQTALEKGVKIVACQMSMDVMGIKKEELIDGVEVGGVASYLGAAELADTNLFI